MLPFSVGYAAGLHPEYRLLQVAEGWASSGSACAHVEQPCHRTKEQIGQPAFWGSSTPAEPILKSMLPCPFCFMRGVLLDSILQEFTGMESWHSFYQRNKFSILAGHPQDSMPAIVYPIRVF